MANSFEISFASDLNFVMNFVGFFDKSFIMVVNEPMKGSDNERYLIVIYVLNKL